LRGLHQLVVRALSVVGPRADDHGPGDVGTVAVHDRAEIDQQPFARAHGATCRVRMRHRRARATRDQRRKRMTFTPVTAQRGLEHARDLELGLTHADGIEGIGERIGGKARRRANGRDFPPIFAHPQSLDELTHRPPAKRGSRWTRGQPLGVLDRECVRFIADRAERAAQRR
jgi:hypothetical protein